MKYTGKYIIFGGMVFVLGLCIGYGIRPTPPNDANIFKPSISNDNKAHKQAKENIHRSKLIIKIDELEQEKRRLEDRNVILNEKLQSLDSQEKDPVYSFGLDSEYVKKLPMEGLSQNLIVTTEGQVSFGMARSQVERLNLGLKQILEEFIEYEKKNAHVEMESENEVVITIPSQDQSNIEEEIQKLFICVLGEKNGQTFFFENSFTMMKVLSGYGKFSHVVTILKRSDKGVDIYNEVVKPDGTVPFSSREGVNHGDVPPLSLGHLIDLVDW